MAHVEIYKLRDTAPKEIRGRSVFDFMHKGQKPDPAHYTKEWAGQMYGTLPLTIPGRLKLETPEDYHGGDIKNGDIAIVYGRPHYFDSLHGGKFIELDGFETEGIRQAAHMKYGWFVSIEGAEAISNELAYICEEIDVPIGYLGKQSDGGIYNDRRPFMPGAGFEENLNFIHPHFLNGAEAREFIGLLTELADVEIDRWQTISKYLRERSPISLQDLMDAREQFVPELLLPEVVRPLHKYIPTDADKWEIAYLADKIEFLDDEQRSIFNAVAHLGWQCGSVAEIINLTETLDCFEIRPALNENMYGHYRLEQEWEDCEPLVSRLEKSEDPAEQALAKHIRLLNRAVDEEAYGYHAARAENGVFTPYGLLTTEGSGEPRTVYRDTQDLPAGYRTADSLPDAGQTESDMTAYPSSKERLALGGKPSVLVEIAESRETARNKPTEPRDKPDLAPGKRKSDPDL